MPLFETGWKRLKRLLKRCGVKNMKSTSTVVCVKIKPRKKPIGKPFWAVKQIFFNKYKDFLSSYLHLKDNGTHQDIAEDLEEKVNKGMEVNKALNRVMPKLHTKFDGLLQLNEDEENEEE